MYHVRFFNDQAGMLALNGYYDRLRYFFSMLFIISEQNLSVELSDVIGGMTGDDGYLYCDSVSSGEILDLIEAVVLDNQAFAAMCEKTWFQSFPSEALRSLLYDFRAFLQDESDSGYESENTSEDSSSAGPRV